MRKFVPYHPDAMLGHTRLSIIDLSCAASQPMSNEDGNIWVVFNGEIYNHVELRSELIAFGHQFRTDHSDTEVLLHGFEEWGEALVDRLRGMFAFAILCLRSNRVFLARDRFGEKPLYLAATPKGICFASELKALLASGLIEREICSQGLRDYLGHGFIPAPRSIFRGVFKLAAAQCVMIDLNRPDQYVPRTYWRPTAGLGAGLPATQALEEFIHELDRSILLRMQADVPLGAFLSGGLDSTTVVRSMARSGTVNTFTIGFRNSRFDETDYSIAASRRYGTAHRVEILDPDAMLGILPIIQRHYDEPFADSSAIPTYMVSRMARARVTVALSGDGGDELLCGYRHHRILHQIGRLLDQMPREAINLVSRSARKLYPESMRGYGLISLLAASDFERFMKIWLDDYFLDRLPGDGAVGPGEVLRRLWAEVQGVGVEHMAAVESQFYVPEDLMVKVDRASMAVSLEARAPLLDHHLFEAAASVPLASRFNGRLGKLPFRTLLEADLGSEFVNRPKSGFAVPLGMWFKGPLREESRETLLDPLGIVTEILPRREVEALIEMHDRGTRDQSARLWRLFALQRWHAIFGRAPVAAVH
jgi:asparagine synthase (glutamine-hydrolysing)